jgi:hypothetical protein
MLAATPEQLTRTRRYRSNAHGFDFEHIWITEAALLLYIVPAAYRTCAHQLCSSTFCWRSMCPA